MAAASSSGASGVLEPMIARGNGLDLMFAVPTGREARAAGQFPGLVVRANSDIQRAADLAGKKISVGLINSINHVHMLEWLRKNGTTPRRSSSSRFPSRRWAMRCCAIDRRGVGSRAVPDHPAQIRNVRVLAYPYQENSSPEWISPPSLPRRAG